ncbi:protein kinase [bacterium]|nr:protein kinase [bacterium]
MPTSQAEIDFGRAVLARRLATEDHIRECVAIQQRLPQPLHLGAILVKKGYLREQDARDLLAEMAASSGVAGSGFSRPAAAPVPPGYPPPPSTTGSGVQRAPGQVAAVCATCGASFPAPASQAGQRFRCRACGATVVVPGPLPQPGSYYGNPPSGLVRPPQGSGPSSSSFPSRGAKPDGKNGGLHRTQVVEPAQIAPQVFPVVAPSSGFGSSPVSETSSPRVLAADIPATDSPGPRGTQRQRSDMGAAPKSAAGVHAPLATGPPPESNLAPDDPIAHVMEARRNADGTVETVFGPYDIVREIARGGMGVVYRARQRDLKRIVALKVMKEGEGASKKQIKRFQRETETAAKLQHPNIVAVHEVGCHQGFHYFTMDLIEGDALDQIVKRGEKMEIPRVLQIVEEVAQAVHYAHGKGIIHRDLKPANILLDTDGHPKVTDFGLAKSIDHKSMLTRAGAAVGTPFYMPPEQTRGDNDIDQRADVYALGVILYELLTLKVPFRGETTMEVYHKILEEEPVPPRQHDPKIPPDVQTICLKAMDKEAARRYQTAKDLADDVARFIQGEPIAARPMNALERLWKRAKKNLLAVVVSSILVVAVAGCLAGVLIWRHQRDAKEWRAAKDREWDRFKTDVDNQTITVRSQINDAISKLKGDHDPANARAVLAAAIDALDNLPKIGSAFQKYNTKAETDQYIASQAPRLAAIYRDAWREMGNAWQATTDNPEAFSEALKAYRKALEHDGQSKESLDVLLAIARVQAKKGSHDESLATLGQILEKEPSHAKALLERGSVHDLRHEHKKAIEDYSRVIEKEADANDAYLRRGGSFFELHQYEEARKDFEHVIEHREQDWNAYIWRGRVRQALGDYGGANDDISEAIELQPSFPDGYFYRAELCFAQRKLTEAIKDYEVAITRSSTYYQAYLGKARALEWTLEDTQAAQQYEDVLKATDRDAQAVRPLALAAKARLLAAKSDPLEVLAECDLEYREEKAEKGGPLGPPPPLAELASRSEPVRAQREKKAREAYDEALKLSPRLLPALVGRAKLALASSDLPLAKKVLETAESVLGERPWPQARPQGESRDPDLAEVIALRGRVALVEKDIAGATSRFASALGADRECALALAGLGAAYAAQGNDLGTRAVSSTFFRAARLKAGYDPRVGIERSKDERPADEEVFFFQYGLTQSHEAERAKKPDFYTQARQSFARALAKDPAHATARLERGRLAADWKAWDLALEDANRAIEADPFLREAYELRGFLYGRDLPISPDPKTQRPKALRDPAKAILDFTRAIDVAESPEDAASARYGRALARTGLDPAEADGASCNASPDATALKEAALDLEEAIRWIPQDLLRWMRDERTRTERITDASSVYKLYACVAKRLGDADGYRAALKKAASVRENACLAAKDALEAGRTLVQQRRYPEAVAAFDRSIALDPELSEAYYERGTCYLKIGNFVPGILDFSRALELNPRYADQFYNKVYQVSYVVDLQRVITELNKIVADHPDVSYVIFLRGFFYVAKTEFKKYDHADIEAGLRDFDRTLQLNPKHVTAVVYRGFLHYKAAQIAEGASRQAEFERALADYALTIERDPASGIAHFLRAMCYSVLSAEPGITPEEKVKRVDQSVEELRVSIEEKDFKGFDRVKNDHGFDAVRKDPRVERLVKGK